MSVMVMMVMMSMVDGGCDGGGYDGDDGGDYDGDGGGDCVDDYDVMVAVKMARTVAMVTEDGGGDGECGDDDGSGAMCERCL